MAGTAASQKSHIVVTQSAVDDAVKRAIIKVVESDGRPGYLVFSEWAREPLRNAVESRNSESLTQMVYG